MKVKTELTVRIMTQNAFPSIRVWRNECRIFFSSITLAGNYPTPSPSCQKLWLWGMFLEMIEKDPFSLSYEGAVPNIFKGSLAFFQKRCYLIYCNAYCGACTAWLPTWPVGNICRRVPPLAALLQGKRGDQPTAVFLICYWCAQECTFLGCCLSKRLSSMEIIPALLLVEILLQFIWDPQKIKTIPPSWSSTREC